MLLRDKVAVIYGGAGEVGGAVARAFAAEGARVFLGGRTRATLDAVAAEIVANGGKAEAGVVDALDSASIEAHLDTVMARAGRIDISFNAIDSGDTQGAHLTAMSEADFFRPMDGYLRSNFLTGTATARRMAAHKSGVVLAITANAGKVAFPNAGGFGVVCAAVEALCRQLAVEVGPDGIRVVCLRSAGSPDARGVREAFTIHARNAGVTLEEMTRQAAAGAPLRHLPLLAEVAGAAVLMASDKASAITAAVTNVTCGGIVD